MRERDKLITEHFWKRFQNKVLTFGGLADLGLSGMRVPRIAIFFAVSILLTVAMLAVPTVSPAAVAVGVSVTVAPPPLPVYAQPPYPGPRHIWTPGYWAWSPETGYYWVPGAWVVAPFVGALWTPGYWGWGNGVFVWHAGYWGPVVGFYGGINYGFGYTGFGYAGGYWRNGTFFYNRAVNNINVTRVRNVYNKTVVNNVSRVSYNGGKGGITARPTAAQLATVHERHSPPTGAQLKNERVARNDPKQRAAVNHGRPAVAAVEKPGVLSGHGAVPARHAGTSVTPSRHIAGAPARTPNRAGKAEKQPGIAAHRHAAPSPHTGGSALQPKGRSESRRSAQPGIAFHSRAPHAPQHRPQSKGEAKRERG